MAAAGHHHDRRVPLPTTDRRALAALFLERPQAAAAGVGDRGDRHVHHAQHRHAVFHQGDVDGELAVALDEFLGAVERVHQPETGPVLAVFIGDAAGFLGEHRNLRGQGLQARLDQVVGGAVGLGDRAVVVLVVHVHVAAIVDFKDGGAGVHGDGGYRAQQGVQIVHSAVHQTLGHQQGGDHAGFGHILALQQLIQP